ncbi:hypothetical protein M3923_002838 [Vibrio metschnikovii]|nr:hypothetical protein [Vibrio metschnikovii]
MNQINVGVDLLVGICLTKKDWLQYKDNLIISCQNISQAWDNKVIFFVVLQGNKNEIISQTDLPDSFFLYETEAMGVSLARNKCIEEAVSKDIKYILFHDASIFWPLESAQYISLNRELHPKVKVSFSDFTFHHSYSNSNGGIKRIVNPIYDTYVWSYLLKVADIESVRFSEKFGPGGCTRYKSGEDVIFLFDYCNKIKSREVFEAQFLCVYHPPRSKKFDKHLIYAKGQGKVYQILLGRYPSFVLYRDLLLFFGNAIFRCLLLRPNSFNILKNRINGFFNRGI